MDRACRKHIVIVVLATTGIASWAFAFAGQLVTSDDDLPGWWTDSRGVRVLGR
jgi:hypothetical protein